MAAVIFVFFFFLAHLPNIEQVTFLIVNQVSVENEVAVSSVEVSVPFRIHWDQLQILNPPHLKGFTVESDKEWGFYGFQLCIWSYFNVLKREDLGRFNYDAYFRLACAIIHHSLLSSNLWHHVHQRGIKLALRDVS